MPIILVVDDEKHTREGLRRALSDKYDVYVAPDLESAWNVLDAQPVDVVLADVRLGSRSGLELLEKLSSLSPKPICIMMTAYGSVDNAVEAMKRGAYDYLTKPLNLEKLELVIERALRSRRLQAENEELRRALDLRYGLEGIIASSRAMQPVLEKIRQVAGSRATVLLEGESGTGKELVAHALHRLSPRKDGPFVPVHCAALSPQLLESELFGHEKGAFTGALERRIGRFEQAHRGTIFLDEIGEIDLSTQVKLLRVLGERTIQRVGSNQSIPVDVRVIAATNRNLEKLVAEGKFREDLFFRLNVVRIELPPLRERKEDLPLLIQAFIREFSRENQKKITGLTAAAQEVLFRYDWPGNVRELKMAIEHGVVLARGEKIDVCDLPERIVRGPSFVANPDPFSLGHGGEENLNLVEMEKRLIRAALERCHGNRTKAAERLGISRRTLHRKMLAYGLSG